MRAGCPFCRWQVFAPILLAVSLAGTIGGCSMVEGQVDRNARSALTSAGVDDVTVGVSYRDVTATGPTARRPAALAALAAADGVADVTFVSTDGTARVATPVAVRLGGGRIVLAGSVPADEYGDRLVTAATAAVGADNVQNNLTVSGQDASEATNAALGVLVSLVSAMNEDLTGGTARIDGDLLRIAGQLRTEDADAIAAATDRARGAGVQVTTSYRSVPPANARPAAVQAAVTDAIGTTTIEFATGSSTLTANSQRILTDVSRTLSTAMGRNLALRVRIEGHTDNVGDPARNRTLSINRAREVRKYLIGRGVPADRLQAFGFGDTRPLKSNATEEGRRVNRRIAFRVLGG